MKGNHSLTDDELKQFSEQHLRYEVNMLFWTTSLLLYMTEVKDKGEIAGVLNNGLLNSFSVHTRNLIGFLYSRKLNNDFPSDVVVEDYIQDAQLYTRLPPITLLLEEAKTKTDKQVSHITMERFAYEKDNKEWKFVAIFQDIMIAFLRIADLFPEDRASKTFLDAITKREVAAPKLQIDQLFEGTTATGIKILARLKKGDDQLPFSLKPTAHTG